MNWIDPMGLIDGPPRGYPSIDPGPWGGGTGIGTGSGKHIGLPVTMPGIPGAWPGRFIPFPDPNEPINQPDWPWPGWPTDGCHK
jgi:hypothetical protein